MVEDLDDNIVLEKMYCFLNNSERLWRRDAYIKKLKQLNAAAAANDAVAAGISDQPEGKPNGIPKGRSKYSLVGDPCITQPGFLETLKRKRSVLDKEIKEDYNSPASKKKVLNKEPTIVYIVLDDVDTIPNHLLPYLSEETQRKIRQKRKVKLSEINFEKNPCYLNGQDARDNTKENNREFNSIQINDINPINKAINNVISNPISKQSIEIVNNNQLNKQITNLNNINILNDNLNSKNNNLNNNKINSNNLIQCQITNQIKNQTLKQTQLEKNNRLQLSHESDNPLNKQHLDNVNEHKKSKTLICDNKSVSKISDNSNFNPQLTKQTLGIEKDNKNVFTKQTLPDLGLQKDNRRQFNPQTIDVCETQKGSCAIVSGDYINNKNRDVFNLKNREITSSVNQELKSIYPQEGPLGISETSLYNVDDDNNNEFNSDEYYSRNLEIDDNTKISDETIEIPDIETAQSNINYNNKPNNNTTKPNPIGSKKPLDFETRTFVYHVNDEPTNNNFTHLKMESDKIEDNKNTNKINNNLNNIDSNINHVQVIDCDSDDVILPSKGSEITFPNTNETNKLPNDDIKTNDKIADVFNVKSESVSVLPSFPSLPTTTSISSSNIFTQTNNIFTTSANEIDIEQTPKVDNTIEPVNSSLTMEIEDEVTVVEPVVEPVIQPIIKPVSDTTSTFPVFNFPVSTTNTFNIFNQTPQTTQTTVNNNSIFSFPSLAKSETPSLFSNPFTQNSSAFTTTSSSSNNIAPNIFGGGLITPTSNSNLNTNINSNNLNNSFSTLFGQTENLNQNIPQNQTLSQTTNIFGITDNNKFPPVFSVSNSTALNNFAPKSEPFSMFSSLPKPNTFNIAPVSTLTQGSLNSIPLTSQPSFQFNTNFNPVSTQPNSFSSLFDNLKQKSPINTNNTSPFKSVFPSVSQSSFSSSVANSNPFSNFASLAVKSETSNQFSSFSQPQNLQNSPNTNQPFKNMFDTAKTTQSNFSLNFSSGNTIFGAKPLITSQQTPNNIFNFSAPASNTSQMSNVGNLASSQQFGTTFSSANTQSLFSTPVSSAQNPFMQNLFGGFGGSSNNTVFNTPSQPTANNNIFGSNTFQTKTELNNAQFGNSQFNQPTQTNLFSSLSNPASSSSQVPSFNFNTSVANTPNSNPFSFNFQNASNQSGQGGTGNTDQFNNNRRFIRARRNFRR